MARDRLRAALTLFLVAAACASASAAAPAPSAASAPLALPQLLLAAAGFALLAAAAKASPLLPAHLFRAADRALAAALAGLLALALWQHVAVAVAAGGLSLERFMQYFVAGGVCALLTHAACTPIDVVKTRIQTTHAGKYAGLLDGMRVIIADEGQNALLKGLGATAGGYFLHGAFKYSFYEVFKVLLAPDAATALKPPLLVAAAAGFCAECIACMLLCPMEAVRIRSVSDLTFPSGAIAGLMYIAQLEGWHGMYKGLPAMLLKQVPYTVGQFVAFEYTVVIVRAAVFTVLLLPGGSKSTWAAAVVSMVAGLLAGIFAGIISHPGDTILSKVNQEESEGGALVQIQRVLRATGVRGLFAGLSVRIVQVACMVGGQFLIYDIIKLVRARAIAFPSMSACSPFFRLSISNNSYCHFRCAYACLLPALWNCTS
jgi:solute carrier family 25 (mitochondrial phosphate transporter), member 3